MNTFFSSSKIQCFCLVFREEKQDYRRRAYLRNTDRARPKLDKRVEEKDSARSVRVTSFSRKHRRWHTNYRYTYYYLLSLYILKEAKMF